MRLSEFIRTHLDEILEAWEEAAKRRAPAGVANDVVKLRDNSAKLLLAIAGRMDDGEEESESDRERLAPGGGTDGVQGAGEAHGAERADQGFTLNQMIAEFPTLRSTVVWLWRESNSTPTPDDWRDLARFHAGVDLALSESVAEFMGRVDRAKETFLGVLGHDLRDPLSTIQMSAKLLRELPLENSHREEQLGIIERTGQRLNQMVGDLLDFTRSRLGKGIPVEPRAVDLQKVVRDAADEIIAANPDRDVRVETHGALHGEWDDRRISQALGNLLGNALQHGAPSTPVSIVARGAEREVEIAVHNEGPPIPVERRRQIFEPLMGVTDRGSAGDRDKNHLGLGLYIANEIARRHGGRVDVDSSAEQGTTFTIRLPRSRQVVRRRVSGR